ncbi:glutathione transferase GstA [Pseudomonas vancouverensis]|uniref:Glutathione transferase GstA n=1 Tax=Pseudomonas vancouverensis TaxID=95300 RepID=A0A1H2NNR9_PSEVA|nr:glutathione transferase GstA [Pseudomonas vancouverensis]KAB0495383.1 glutathione transferase GstA [Pseudomonas vancouverensis]TDB62456.1 glutathione transferase GstA [Pseudomonas vancouverensis]SDV07147.1 glutathione S-transferase [Pseudomonas vancouverensis]
MKLYYIPGSCSLSPHIVINELGLDVTLLKVDHRSHTLEGGEDYYGINPLGYVPVLELADGTRLREGSAIVQFLADLKPEMKLAPPNGSLERYRLQEWLGFLTSEIHKGFIPLLYAGLAGRYVDTAKPKLEARYEWIDKQLAGRQFVLGDTFTVADAYLFALTGWGQADWLKSYYKAGIHFDGLENLQAWYARVRQRPAVQNALKVEGLQ